jgi:hypothetical protein
MNERSYISSQLQENKTKREADSSESFVFSVPFVPKKMGRI